MHATDVQVLFVGVVSDVVYGYVDFVFKISSEGSEKYREVNNKRLDHCETRKSY